jgi:glycosyltransferase involved in cell wall biosynthesis
MSETRVEISVVLAVYNGELYLKEAIDSILSQTFDDFELILINDGSTDRTENIIKSYSDPRIVYVLNEENKGLVYSLNRGISLSRGKYIARMDSDDIALPERFRIQYDYMESHPEVGVCGSYIEAFFNVNPQRSIVRFPQTDHLIRTYAFFQPPFSHPSVMLKRAVFVDNHVEYSGKYLHAEDYALWVELLKHTLAHNIPLVLLYYRVHNDSITVNTRRDRNFMNAILIQQEYLQQNNITISLDDTLLFSRFVNRHLKYDLRKEDLPAMDRIVKLFFTQLLENGRCYYTPAMDFISSACFFRFFKAGRYPGTPFLQKLYWRGIWTFAQKAITYPNRLITRYG